MRVLVSLLLMVLLAASPARAQDDDGPGFLTRLIQDNLSSEGRQVSIRGFEGALSSRATMEELTISDENGVWLTLRGAVLDWNRSALLRGRLEVEELSAQELLLPRLPQGEDTPPEAAASEPFRIPELPVSVDIGRLAIERAEIGAPLLGQDAELTLEGAVQLAGGSINADIEARRTDDQTGVFSIDVAYDAGSTETRVNVALEEGESGIIASKLGLPGEPALALRVTGDAPLAEFVADITLETDDEPRLTGTVQLAEEADPEGGPLLRRFTAELSGDLAPVFTPDYRPFFGPDISLTATGSQSSDGRVELSQLSLQARSITLEGSLAIAADGLPERFDLQGRIADETGAQVLLPFGAEETRVTEATIDAQFDAESGDEWSAVIGLQGLSRPDLSLDTAQLEGSGVIRGGGTDREVAAVLDFSATGFDHQNEALVEGLGTDFSGQADLVWQDGAPLTLNSLALNGADYGIEAEGTLAGAGQDFALDGRLSGRLDNLSRFSALAGLPLDGAADAELAGNATLNGGSFDLTLEVAGTDIAVGNPELDRLLAGRATISAAVQRDTTGLTIERMQVDAAELDVDLTGQLAGPGQTDGTLDFTARLADVGPYAQGLNGPLELEAQARQEGEDWRLTMSGNGPGRAALELRSVLSELRGDRRFDGTLTAAIGDLRAYGPLLDRPLEGEARLTVQGSGKLADQVFEVTVDGNARNLATGIAQLDGLLAGEVEIDATAQRQTDTPLGGSLTLVSDALNVQAQGRLGVPGVEAGGTVDLNARLVDIGALVPDLSGPVTVRGTARQETAARWDLDFEADAPGDSRLAIAGMLDQLDGPIRFDGTAEADIGDLSTYRGLAKRPVDGALRARIEGQVLAKDQFFDLSLQAGGTDLEVGIAPVDGLLAGESALTAQASRDADGIVLDTLRLTAPDLNVTADGAYREDGSNLTLDANLANAGRLAPGMSGPLSISAEATQDGDTWDTRLDASGPGDAGIAWTGTVEDPQGAQNIAGRLEASAESLAAFAPLAGRPLRGAITLTAEGEGSVGAQTFDIVLDAEGRDLGLGIADADRLLRGTSTLKIDADRDETGTIRVDIATLDSDMLRVNLDGTTGRDGNAFTLDARLADLGVFAPGFSGPVTLNGASEKQENNRWRVDASVTAPGNTRADLTGTVDNDVQDFDLRANGATALGLINRFIAPRSIQGPLSFDLALRGSPALENISGSLRASDARVALPTLEMSLTGLDLSAQLSGGRATIDLGTGLQSGGRVQVRGPIGLSAPFDAGLDVSLQEVRLVDPELYQSSVSGSLRIAGPLTGGGSVTGNLALGRSEVKVPSTGLGGVGDIPDIDHVGEPRDVRITRARAGAIGNGSDSGGSGSGGSGNLSLDINIRADNPIFIRGRGLDAEFGGALRVTGTTAQIIPVGRFDLQRGRLDILGRRLDIEEGYVQLQGDFDPYIYVVAVGPAGDVQVQIVVEGPVSDPEITFRSQPSLPQDEVLAQLLFGRDLTSLSPLQAAQLASAVATLAGRGGDGIIGKLRRNFGLDDLDVTSSDGTAAVRAGKYLSENVYTNVEVDDTGKTEVTINIDLSDSVKVRGAAASDGETGFGVFFEKDY